jgi:spore germination protein
MLIHVVQNGETMNSIADKYGVSADRLMIENGRMDSDRLVVGETIVILYPDITYTIQEGDTLDGIADRFEITVYQLLRNNPYLSDREFIYPGETIVISYEGNKIRAIATNGYAYPFIAMDVLRKTLPFLTYLTILGYKVTAKGEINDIEDTEIIRITSEYGTEPVMMLEALSQNMEEEINVIHLLLSSVELQNKLIDNILSILKTKGYGGVNISTPYLIPMDRSLYLDFFTKFADRLSKEGYKVYVSFSMRIFQLLNGTIFTGLEYTKLAQEADRITLITYVFGYSEGIPQGTLSMDTFSRFLEYTTRLITPEKTDIGITVMGYVWSLPYIPGTSKGMAISYNAAIDIAGNNNVEIQFDEITNSAYFQYIVDNEYVVRFWDARSIDNFAKLVPEFGLYGISIWNIMNWFPQMWLVINSQYDIDKVM